MVEGNFTGGTPIAREFRRNHLEVILENGDYFAIRRGRSDEFGNPTIIRKEKLALEPRDIGRLEAIERFMKKAFIPLERLENEEGLVSEILI